MVIKNWNIEALTGYKPITTFYTDFSIADVFGGARAVKDTYRRAFDDWKGNFAYLTEMVMVLNWKSWEHSESNEELCELYCELYEKTAAYAEKHLKGDELAYYYRVTD